jgi:hypothetical protein
MTEKYSEEFLYEIAFIGDAIEYLEEHLNGIIECNSVPGTNILDAESKLWVEQVEEIIDNLKLGTVGGRTFELERTYRKNEAKVAEAWKEFRENNPEYFREVS